MPEYTPLPWWCIDSIIAPFPSVARRFLCRSSFFGLGVLASGFVVRTSEDSCFKVCVKFLLASAKALGSNFGLLAEGSPVATSLLL